MKVNRSAILGTLFSFAAPLAAQTVPGTINYQGRLTDNTPSQSPVNANVQMQFGIYDAASGGTRLWQEPAADDTGTTVTVTGGIFNYVLGNTVAIPATVFTGFNSSRYLQITINPAGSAEILSPRQLITATGYANLAQNANAAVSAATATTAANSTQLGGVAASGYLLSGATAFDSARLGGTLASGWQKALTTPACSPNQFLTTVNQNGTTICASPTLSETDPKVGTLTTGRVPYWNATSLTNGSLFDTGSRIGIGTAVPIAQLHVAGAPPAVVSTTPTGNNPEAIHVQGRYVYLANNIEHVLQILDVSNPLSPAVVGSGSTGANSYPRGLDVQGRYAYIVGGGDKFGVIDISNPAAPALIGTALLAGYPMDVQIQGRNAFVVNYSTGSLQIIDVSKPASPSVVSTLITTPNPRAVQVQGRYAYLVDDVADVLQVVDVINPLLPAIIATVPTDSDPYAVAVQGRYAYVANGAANTLQIFDISNPAAVPAAVGSASNSGGARIKINGRFAYVQSGGFLKVVDISTPTAPYLVSQIFLVNNAGVLDVQGRYAYVAHGFTANALRVVDLGGAYVQQFEAGGIETGVLSTLGNARVAGDLMIAGGLGVGSAGLYSAGGIASAGQFKMTGGAPGAGKVLTSDSTGLATWQTPAGGTVTTVSASSPLASSGGAAPNITLNGVVAIANGGTGSATQNFMDLSTPQTLGGAKTFSSPIAGSVTGTAANVTGIVAIANGGTGSAMQNFVDLTTGQTVAGAKNFSTAGSFTAAATALTVTNIAAIGTVETGTVQKTAGTLALSASGANMITASTNGAERLRIDSTGTLRAAGQVRLGSETGTSQAPALTGGYTGLVVRRINSTTSTGGSVVARTDQLTLERDGTAGGFRVSYGASPGVSVVACLGMTAAGTAVNFYGSLGNPGSAGSVTVYTDAQAVVHIRCSFGNTYSSIQLTEVTLTRDGTDNYWSGNVVSTFNQ